MAVTEMKRAIVVADHQMFYRVFLHWRFCLQWASGWRLGCSVKLLAGVFLGVAGLPDFLNPSMALKSSFYAAINRNGIR
jgi:hypothetical protein